MDIFECGIAHQLVEISELRYKALTASLPLVSFTNYPTAVASSSCQCLNRKMYATALEGSFMFKTYAPPTGRFRIQLCACSQVDKMADIAVQDKTALSLLSLCLCCVLLQES